jgi:hypothetical protein
MACGTGGDQATTFWSIQAITKHTRISKNRAGLAVERLIEKGLVTRLSAGSRPRYRLATWAEVTGKIQHHGPLTAQQEAVLDLVRERRSINGRHETVAKQLQRLNRVCIAKDNLGNRFWTEVVSPKPELAFIPNSFVTGVKDETPPLERLRRMLDPQVLRLAVDLYAVHMQDDGGIPKSIIRREYTRIKKAEFGPYVIYDFQARGLYGARGLHGFPGEIVRPHTVALENKTFDWTPFWRRFQVLLDCEIIEFVPILFEAANDEAEPLFPLGYGGTESIEDRLGTATHAAAKRMLSRRYNLRADAPGLGDPSSQGQLVPIYKKLDQATMYGIARMRYRAQTARTGNWFAEVEERGAEYLAKWHQIIDDVELHAESEDIFYAA